MSHTSSNGGAVGAVYVVLLTVLVASGYALSCWWWPFKACGNCTGGKVIRKDGGKVWRTCKKCGGSGKKLRVGRAVYNRLHRRSGPS